ncbi:hypothetical protein ILUMI_12015 [Ignelater luminosus]|uniref:THAP-type domain-containing protein n=1 Tax=Ignelater luminosus TaxID=2038154 RepID=A0A8K0CZA0_IGNLU|nr:hypothetical protein ILUMI_12015 [Ignelater luminosus]
MPGTRCCVSVCNNNYVDARKRKLNISFHSFPKDEKIRKIWIQKCSRTGNFNPATSVICSTHFQEEDFERDLRAELLNLKPRGILKKAGSSDRSLRKNKQENKKIVEELLNASTSVTEFIVGDVTNVPRKEETIDEKYQKLLVKHEALQERHKTLRIRTYALERNIEKLRKEVLTAVRNLNLEKSKCLSLETILNTTFSKAQIEILRKQRKKVHWSSDDISSAFAIRYLSKRCYLYLRNKLNYPLPHISTLQRWASKLQLEEGILKDVLRIIKIAGMDMSKLEKVTVLQFDEIKVNSLYEYDETEDEVKGPYNCMKVVMARGLFKNWKQPVFIDFDKKITVNCLNEIIKQLHHIDYTVVACVSDCGDENVDLWSALNVTPENTHFKHPITNKNIYMFAYAPHLLKLLRNWLLDTGFILDDGTVIERKPLEALLNIVDDCHELTERHLNCQRTDRQNVDLATQLLSRITATALCHYCPGDDKEKAVKTGKFIELMSNWFDMLNSYTEQASLHTKKPYGLYVEEQNEVLDNMYKMINSMLCIGKTSLQNFQKGILITITSLKALLVDLKAEHKIAYIITSRLNQDSLEKIMEGLHDHPSPLQALHRFRLFILGKNSEVLQQKTNTEMSNDIAEEEYLIAKVITTADINIDSKLSSHEDEENISSSSEQSELSHISERTQEGNATEEDRFKYLCYWIARKFKHKYPAYLSCHTKVVPECDHQYAISSLSEGLTNPSEDWITRANHFENIFQETHKTEINRKRNIVQLVANKIKNKFSDFPKEIIKTFVLQRTYIRIESLNAQQIKKRPISDDLEIKKETKKVCT